MVVPRNFQLIFILTIVAIVTVSAVSMAYAANTTGGKYSPPTNTVTPRSPAGTGALNTSSVVNESSAGNKASTSSRTVGRVGNANAGGDVVSEIGRVISGGKGARTAFYVLAGAIVLILALYIWFMPLKKGRKGGKAGEYARLAEIQPPRGYDFVTYTVDGNDRVIRKEKYIKLSDNFYLSTSVTSPTFLYIPSHVRPYLCRDGKSMIPCGLAFKKGIMSIIVDPELAASNDLAAKAGIISLENRELDKLLSDLYKKEEMRVGEVAISPETKVAFGFNLENMIKGHLGILRAANDMMIHFLNTASEAENIEKFMKTAAKMAGVKLNWLKWVAYIIMASAIAIAMIQVLRGGH